MRNSFLDFRYFVSSLSIRAIILTIAIFLFILSISGTLTARNLLFFILKEPAVLNLVLHKQYNNHQEEV